MLVFDQQEIGSIIGVTAEGDCRSALEGRLSMVLNVLCAGLWNPENTSAALPSSAGCQATRDHRQESTNLELFLGPTPTWLSA